MRSGTLADSTLIAPDEGRAVEVLNPGGKGPAVIVCEHASARLPHALGDLGLSVEGRLSHAAWDPGALDVAQALSAGLDAPLVAARFSRLAYDCNRPPERADAIAERSEVHEVPGNRDLTPEARALRVREIAKPFRDMLAGVIEARLAAGARPAVVTVHSFTPVWFGQPRAVELGLLHDADSRLVDAMLPLAREMTGLRAERNEPYGPEDGVTHTLRVHAVPRGLPNVMIEIRSDLIAEEAARQRIASGLVRLVAAGLAQLGTEARS